MKVIRNVFDEIAIYDLYFGNHYNNPYEYEPGKYYDLYNPTTEQLENYATRYHFRRYATMKDAISSKMDLEEWIIEKMSDEDILERLNDNAYLVLPYYGGVFIAGNDINVKYL
jgi:hypothetical protein